MNIVILTSAYKDTTLKRSDSFTDVVNLFVREWVRMGHNVIVFHNIHRYPFFVHMLTDKMRTKLAGSLGFKIPGILDVKYKEYKDSGALVYKMPILKIRPHVKHSNFAIRKQVKRIIKKIDQNQFKPDLIIGHWASPQMPIIFELKKKYGSKTAMILHGTEYISQKSFNTEKYLKNIDVLGCRSKTESEKVKDILRLEKAPFVCCSGVPDKYVRNFPINEDKFKNIKKWKFICVARFVKYKKIDVIIRALSECKNFDWQLDLVGNGSEYEYIENLVKELGVENRVILHGRVDRDKVVDLMSQAHCFVLVSKGEIFGLVYLESMAASCVSIGSKREGIDGIIIDGENGFLCEAADKDDLVKTIKKLTSMDESDVIRIVRNGYETANKLTNSKVAENYLEKVIYGYE